MKKILLLLCALMFAAPVYAADAAPAAGATQAEPAAKPAKETPKKEKKAKQKKQKKAAAKSTATTTSAGCPTGCVSMNCPPPGGPVACCKKTPTGYVTC